MDAKSKSIYHIKCQNALWVSDRDLFLLNESNEGTVYILYGLNLVA